jgi:hypothetical protein
MIDARYEDGVLRPLAANIEHDANGGILLGRRREPYGQVWFGGT